MDQIIAKYNAACRGENSSDIHEHLPTLRALARECDSIAEFGVRGVVSTWALLLGLIEAGGTVMYCVDIQPAPGIEEVASHDQSTLTYPARRILSVTMSIILFPVCLSLFDIIPVTFSMRIHSAARIAYSYNSSLSSPDSLLPLALTRWTCHYHVHRIITHQFFEGALCEVLHVHAHSRATSMIGFVCVYIADLSESMPITCVNPASFKPVVQPPQPQNMSTKFIHIKDKKNASCLAQYLKITRSIQCKMLATHIDAFVRERNNLGEYLRSLLTEVVRSTLEEVSRDYHKSYKELEEKYLARIVDVYADRESFHVDARVLCKGKCKGGKPCAFQALANGFCKRHADQYEVYAARQRFAMQQHERHGKSPHHNHGPSEEEPVAGCPLCEHKYAKILKENMST